MNWVILFCLSLFAPLQSESRLVEKVVAVTGEEALFLTDLHSFKKQLRAHLVPDSILFKIFPKKTLLTNKSRRLEFLILQKRLAQMAKEKNLPIQSTNFVTNGKIKLPRNKTKGLSSSERAVVKSLKSLGLTLEDFWKQNDSYSTNNLLLSQEVVSKIRVSDNEVDAYHFNKYGRNLFEDFEYEFDSISVANDERGKRKIESFLKDLETVSFSKAAQQKGLKIKTSRLKNSEINPFMYKALKTLSVSQTSNPISIHNNLYLLKLKWKTPFLSLSKQKRQAKIHKHLFEAELKKELKKWIETQRASFPIKSYSP